MTSNAIINLVVDYYTSNGGVVTNVYPISRPTENAGEEFGVVNTLDVPNKIFQELITNVNLYVADINGKVPNNARLTELEANAIDVLDKVHLGEVDLYVQQSKIFRESSTKEHYVNIRLLVKVLK